MWQALLWQMASMTGRTKSRQAYLALWQVVVLQEARCLQGIVLLGVTQAPINGVHTHKAVPLHKLLDVLSSSPNSLCIAAQCQPSQRIDVQLAIGLVNTVSQRL